MHPARAAAAGTRETSHQAKRASWEKASTARFENEYISRACSQSQPDKNYRQTTVDELIKRHEIAKVTRVCLGRNLPTLDCKKIGHALDDSAPNTACPKQVPETEGVLLEPAFFVLNVSPDKFLIRLREVDYAFDYPDNPPHAAR
jgi:hypothetical protein